MTNELKPCPFCGGPARVWLEGDGPTYQHVWCNNTVSCGANIDAPDPAISAVESWNTRTEAAAEIKRLREALADIGMHGCAGRIDKDSVPSMIARAALKGDSHEHTDG